MREADVVKRCGVVVALAYVGLLAGCAQDKKPATSDEKPAVVADDKKPAVEETHPADGAPAFDPNTAPLPFEAIGPIARVAGQDVPAERYNKEVRALLRVTQGRIPVSMLQHYKKQMMIRVVDEVLFDREVARLKIEISPAEAEAEFEKFKKRFPSPEFLTMYYERTGITEADAREEMIKRLRYDKTIKQRYGVAVSEADVKKYYNDNKAEFEVEAQVEASHILVEVPSGAESKVVEEARKKAEQIEAEAKKPGVDFAELAKKSSSGPSASRGGYLGFFPRNRMVKPFADVAFELKKGQISSPVRTQFGFHVIKVTDTKAARTLPFDEVKDKIKEQLEGRKMREAMLKFLEEARKEAKVELLEDNIKVNPAAAQATPSPFDSHGHGHGGHGMPQPTAPEVEVAPKVDQPAAP
jgi:peptidyl-prolyl cis-trans isomerase C